MRKARFYGLFDASDRCSGLYRTRARMRTHTRARDGTNRAIRRKRRSIDAKGVLDLCSSAFHGRAPGQPQPVLRPGHGVYGKAEWQRMGNVSVEVRQLAEIAVRGHAEGRLAAPALGSPRRPAAGSTTRYGGCRSDPARECGNRSTSAASPYCGGYAHGLPLPIFYQTPRLTGPSQRGPNTGSEAAWGDQLSNFSKSPKLASDFSSNSAASSSAYSEVCRC
jgi:hypothetical protein